MAPSFSSTLMVSTVVHIDRIGAPVKVLSWCLYICDTAIAFPLWHYLVIPTFLVLLCCLSIWRFIMAFSQTMESFHLCIHLCVYSPYHQSFPSTSHPTVSELLMKFQDLCLIIIFHPSVLCNRPYERFTLPSANSPCSSLTGFGNVGKRRSCFVAMGRHEVDSLGFSFSLL